MSYTKRLIDANDLWQKTFVCDEVAEVRKFIEQAPTVDAVEVVRCKDCKYRGSDLCPMETVELYPWFGTKNDAFCSYGERRSDG